MIKNFEEIKQQLGELATVVNAFKSEAVQLRIVDLILGRGTEPGERDASADNAPLKKRTPRRRKSRETQSGVVEGKEKRRGSVGPARTLDLLIEEGFFKKRQTIGQIIEHSSSNKARVIKPNDISGPLARFVRDGRLKRQKNTDGQYEYYIE